MASAPNSNIVFKDGGSSNKPPCFVGEYYDFWKIHMRAYLEAQGEEIWNAVENGPFIPTTVVNDVVQVKIKTSWTDDDKKKLLFDKKAINMLHSALGMDEFFRISQCKTAKEIWDTLEVTHEGTEEVKRSKLNTLSQEYELFRMQPGESILDLQKRFSHLTNHLMALGKTFTNDELNLKVLRSLTRAWQPKVTAISEKKSLSKMTSAALFGKLQEHEMELGRLEKHEVQEKKNKSIALRVESKQQNEGESSDEGETINLLAKSFKKFLRKDKSFKFGNKGKSFKKNEGSTSNQNFTCFGCGKEGHMKADCPSFTKKNGDKGKKEFKQRRAYIAWEENDISSSSESEDEEYANLALMASHHSDDEQEVSDSEFEIKPSYDELQNAFDELYEECSKLSKTCVKQKKLIVSLERKAFDAQVDLEKVKNSSCNKCKEHETKIVELNQVIKNFEKGHNSLEDVLSKQSDSNNKTGLGFSNFDKPSTSKTIFVKASTTSNNLEPKKMHVVIPLKSMNPRNNSNGRNYSNKSYKKTNFKVRNNVSNGSNSSVYHVQKLSCFYCNMKGHTPNTCYIRNFGVPYGEYIWVRKGINPQGPKSQWVPNKT